MKGTFAKQDLSRRQFLGGAAASGLLAAGGLAGLAVSPESALADEARANDGEGSSQWTWQEAPAPIAESDIVETIESDVVVVGAGLAGCAAACSCAERGLSVSVIEKTSQPNGRGLGAGFLDSQIMREAGVQIVPEPAAALWVRTCASRVRESLVSLFFNRSGEAGDWLIDKVLAKGGTVTLWGGYDKSKQFPDEPCYHMFTGPADNDKEVNSVAGTAGDYMTIALYEDAEAAGAVFYFDAPGVQLVKDGDRVTGIVAQTADGYVLYNANKGVVLATGDVSGDPEMVECFCPETNAALNIYTPVGANTGDGHKMAYWAGAGLQSGPYPPMLHPQAYATFHGAFLFVNTDGKRFMNEGTWVQGKSLGIMRQPNNFAYVVFDKNWMEDNQKTLAEGGGMFWDNFHPYGAEWSGEVTADRIAGFVEGGDLGWSADTIEELADQLPVLDDKQAFIDTIARYNEVCASGADTDFYKNPLFLNPVLEPPFYALKIGAALLTTLGGVHTNDKLEVLTDEDVVVPGLYAVGNVAGDLYTVDYPINITGNSHGRCVTWGYVVGETLANA